MRYDRAWPPNIRSTFRAPMNDPLLRWSRQHAMLMLLGVGAAWLEHATLLMAAMAAGSFLALLVRCRGRYTGAGPFGLANGITLARLGCALWLLAWAPIEPWWQAGSILLLVCADGLDGWVARRRGAVSDFGHLFDQESDAFVLLVACLLLFTADRLGGWILLPGSLRYGFVLFSQGGSSPRQPVRGNRYTRSVGVAATLGFAACLLPVMPPDISFWLAVLLSAALAGSFLYSSIQLYRSAPA